MSVFLRVSSCLLTQVDPFVGHSQVSPGGHYGVPESSGNAESKVRGRLARGLGAEDAPVLVALNQLDVHLLRDVVGGGRLVVLKFYNIILSTLP